MMPPFIPVGGHVLPSEKLEVRIIYSPMGSFFSPRASQSVDGISIDLPDFFPQLYLDSSFSFNFRVCLGISDRPERGSE